MLIRISPFFIVIVLMYEIYNSTDLNYDKNKLLEILIKIQKKKIYNKNKENNLNYLLKSIYFNRFINNAFM